MRVAVDRDHCIGAGSCAMTAPTVFDQDAEEALVILLTDSPPDSDQDAVRQAVDRCPAAVIRLLPTK
ncbi:ferredoxin [Actinoplanes sp. NPDC048988]|uniref:ferredoxin n=1 Tax=Actinoplanes sp. NPDC048988 TaxID=3363901 RepID=UPI00370F86A8